MAAGAAKPAIVGAGGTARAFFATWVAAIALTAGLFIAAHHPLSPPALIIACLAMLLICVRFDHAWLLLLPALLPIVDLNPWTGWLGFEEFDVLALGAAAGAWLRHGWAPGVTAAARPSKLMLGLALLYLVSLAIAFARGITDAGGFDFGWFQGYEGPMNSLRLAKGFLLAVSFAPLLGRADSRLDERGPAYLGWGMTLGLGTVSLAAIWERIAYPGLLDFSTDYRTTALFWEMHVGGAALDGFLALTLPFAVLLLLRSRRPARWLGAGAILALGLYASLTTFSRGVYLALAVSLAVLVSRLLAPTPANAGKPRSHALLAGLTGVLLAAALAFLVFRHGGYRALLALLGCFALFLATLEPARALPGRLRAAAAAITLPLMLGVFALAWLLEKGSYLAYATLFALTLAAQWLARSTGREALQVAALAGAWAMPLAATLVAHHWGGSPALGDMAIALAVLVAAAFWGLLAHRPLWPSGWRSQGIVFAGTAAIAAMVAIFSGGAYMGARFASSERDFQGRLQHWQAGLDLLQTPADWWFGKGLGRFPATFFFGAPGNEFPGSYTLREQNGNPFLALSGPRFQAGFGEVLRIGQRVGPGPAGRYRLEFDYRLQGRAKLVFSLCSKHLLYAENCGGKEIVVSSLDPVWQHQVIEFVAPHLGGTWYAPQLINFSLAVETLGARIDLDDLRLTDPAGREMLANGDFSAGMARWFFTSDHLHLPWHMKSLPLHVLFEQGILGLAVLLSMIASAVMRSITGERAHHPYAPALLAGIAGFLTVGLFDSLLDVPRVAFLFYLVLLIALQGRKAAPTSKIGAGGTA
ncbi:MAG: hypothetical protein HXY29_09465 [Rhodocyclaceae bacterium]|jgi:hypothetical protein|nr:hypothetical protein [Rhodocyclaceae bacterium]